MGKFKKIVPYEYIYGLTIKSLNDDLKLVIRPRSVAMSEDGTIYVKRYCAFIPECNYKSEKELDFLQKIRKYVNSSKNAINTINLIIFIMRNNKNRFKLKVKIMPTIIDTDLEDHIRRKLY